MNSNDAMVMLKDILLCLLGFRFIYIVITYKTFQILPTSLSFGLPISPLCLSVSQTSMDDSSHKRNTGQLLNL